MLLLATVPQVICSLVGMVPLKCNVVSHECEQLKAHQLKGVVPVSLPSIHPKQNMINTHE